MPKPTVKSKRQRASQKRKARRQWIGFFLILAMTLSVIIGIFMSTMM